MEKKRKLSLSFKFFVTIMLMGLLISILIILIGHRIYYKQIVEQYEKKGTVLINTAAKDVDWDKIDYYMETLEEDEEYNKTLESMRLLSEGAGATYLYVFVPDENGSTYIFDTDNTDNRCELGYYMEWYDSFNKYRKQLAAGKPFGPIASDEEYGELLSIYLPFYNSDKQFVGYLGVDYSMEHIMSQQREFTIELIIASLIISVFMTLAFIKLFRHMVLDPIDKISFAAKRFAIIDDDGAEANSSIESLEINTNDELQTLAETIKSMDNKIQEYIENLQIVTQKAETDSLTGLSNRLTFVQRVKNYLTNTDNCERSIFLMIDIDYFKRINDNWGHDIGDKVIKEFADVIKANFCNTDFVARMGGDEFTVFSMGNWSEKDIQKRVESIRKGIKSIDVIDDYEITASIGIALAADNVKSYRRYYTESDIALYDAKEAGRNRYVIRKIKND